MSSVIIAGNTSGTITLDAPNVAGTTTLTLPTTSGTVLTSASTTMPAGSVNQAAIGTNVVGTGPAFSASRDSSQTFSQNTFTKILCNLENFDTNSNYDNATNYRFTPTVAGYYQLNGVITMTSTSSNNRQILAFFKNNSQALRPVDYYITYGAATAMFSGSALVYMNGSTDYVELYVYVTGSGTLSVVAQGAGELSTFSGFLVRAA